MRFYDVQKGGVTLDGVDVREWDLQRLRSSLALVLQDVHLFSGTIASNIRLGSDIPMERVRAAAEAVHAHRFIEQLPKGYDSEVKERGRPSPWARSSCSLSPAPSPTTRGC